MVLVLQDHLSEVPTYCSVSGCHCTISVWPLLEGVLLVGTYIYPMGYDVTCRKLSWLLCQGLKGVLKGVPTGRCSCVVSLVL